MVHDRPDKIKAKRTSNGSPNPRYVTAVRMALDARARRDDLKGTYRHLSRKEIAAQYTDEHVDTLLAMAQENLKAMQGPMQQSMWMLE